MIPSISVAVQQCSSRTKDINMCKGQTTPQVKDSILTSASETESESIVAFNFGGSTSIIIILVVILVGSFFIYRCCGCCFPTRCRTRRDNQREAQQNAWLAIASMAVNQQQQQQQQQRGPVQPGSSSSINPEPQGRLNQALAQIEAKKSGTLARIPQPRKITWTKKEEEEGGIRSGATQEPVPSSAPPPYPEIPGELDIENDPALMEALQAVIINAKRYTDTA